MVVDKEKVEKQAKEILEKFAHSLEKVEKLNDTESYVDRDSFERKEKDGNEPSEIDDEFKKRMLLNSPKHDDDFIIGEKGGWK